MHRQVRSFNGRGTHHHARRMSNREGRRHLALGDIGPSPTLYDTLGESVPILLPRFDIGATEGGDLVPTGSGDSHRRPAVTTVFDPPMAHCTASVGLSTPMPVRSKRRLREPPR
ncbi:hypothetical protein [Nocardia sp. AB354]|uniref:hypothetical protein n=1 Tax=Nocardia sp. AB354 TaxID=3413283 RepID=UPI003C1D22DE